MLEQVKTQQQQQQQQQQQPNQNPSTAYPFFVHCAFTSGMHQ